MNKRPLSESEDADIRGVDAALRRAAQRAREVARTTHTRLVLSRNGRVAYVVPDEQPEAGPDFVQSSHE